MYSNALRENIRQLHNACPNLDLVGLSPKVLRDSQVVSIDRNDLLDRRDRGLDFGDALQPLLVAVRGLGEGREIAFLGCGTTRHLEPIGKSTRGKKGAICLGYNPQVICVDENANALSKFDLVFMPEVEHIEAYLQAGKFSQGGGPAEYYLGSVGKLMIAVSKYGETKTGSINASQSSINHYSDEAVLALNEVTGEDLKNVYAHWNSQLFYSAFQYFSACGVMHGSYEIDSKRFRSSYQKEDPRRYAVRLRRIAKIAQAFAYKTDILIDDDSAVLLYRKKSNLG